MKLRKLLIIAFTFIFVSLFAVSFKVSANTVETSELITVQGAQIRTTGNAGIRFVAKEEYEGTNETAWGIILAFGEAEANEQFVIDGTVNGKEVLKGEVLYTREGEFTATLYNVPEEAYTQVVTARAYVIDGGNAVYSQNVAVKSLAEVALKAKNDGNDAELVNTVVTAMEGYKKVFTDKYNNFYVESAVYESNYVELAKEFIKDVNAMFETNVEYETAFNGSNGSQPLAKALMASSSTAVADTNLYKFFADDAMRAKWGWFLTYLQEQTTVNTANWGTPKAQLDAIIGKDTSLAVGTWYGAQHLTSFFLSVFAGTYKTTGYSGFHIENDMNALVAIGNYNNTVYANLADAEIVKVGDNITLPDSLSKDYYDWTGYTADQLYAANSEYTTTNADLQFVPTFTPTQYTVKFYDGETEITELGFTYDVEDNDIDLPEYVKANYIFNGWYTDKEFTSDKAVKVAAGSNGNKVFYANTEEITGYSITYNFNGGNTKYANYDAVVADLLADYNASGSDTEGPYTLQTLPTGNFKLISSGYANFTTLEVAGVKMSVKWDWLSKYFIGVTTVENGAGANTVAGVKDLPNYPDHCANKSDCQYGTSYTFRSFMLKTQLRKGDAYTAANFADANVQMAYLTYLSDAEQTQYTNLSGETSLLTNVYKEGYTFAGWYTNAEFTGERVYTVNGATTLYAKWEAQ